MIEIISQQSEETIALAREVSQLIQPGTLISLKGPLGSGKTTFTKGLAQGLGIRRVIKSPTYTIVKEYSIPDRDATLYHIDAYRLENMGADTVDIDSFITDRDFTVIEWAEFIEDFLPEDYLIIELIPVGSDSRRIRVSSQMEDSIYQDLLSQLGSKESGKIHDES